jgi:hypothetical protein
MVKGVLDRKAYTAVGAVLVGPHSLSGGIAGANVTGELNEVVGVASQAWQLRHLLGINNLREFLGLRVDLNSTGALHFRGGHLVGDGEFCVDVDTASYG